MIEIFVLIGTAIVSYQVHNWGEHYATRGGERSVKLVVGGYHIHHSFFGLLAGIAGLAVSSPVWTPLCVGYGVGNIVQHKRTHNRVSEKGMVFVSRDRQASNIQVGK